MISSPRLGVLAATAVALTLLTACSGSTDEPSAGAGSETPGTMEVVRVPGDADTVQGGVDLVAPGGLVLVEPGTYPEEVLIDVEDVTLRGTDRDGVVITGEGSRSSGVVAFADGVRIENLTVRDTLLYGVLVTGTHDADEALTPAVTGYDEFDPDQFPPLERFSIDHVTSTNNGLYGIYAFNARHGVITNTFTSGSADSGIYVGQCRECDTLVSGNVATRNAIGFENANASDSLSVLGNRFAGNRVGMTLTSNYQEAFVPQRGNLVAGNVIDANVGADSPAQADGAFGIGIGISGGQENRLVRNRVSGNLYAGVVINNTEDVSSIDNEFLDNVFAGNRIDIANTARPEHPTSGTCLRGAGSDTLRLLPRGLGLGCSGGPDRSVEAPGPIDVPPGASFLDVARPGPLPSLPADDTVPAPLPDRVEHPALDSVPVPAAGLLADLGAA